MKKLVDNLAKEIQPIYHITGNDIFIMEKSYKMIENACNNSMGDINISLFNNENFSVKKILDACEQFPIMADKRFVLVKNILKVKEDEIQQLISYAENPNKCCTLVLCELPSGKVFDKVPSEKVICRKLSEKELFKKIDEKLIKNNKKIEKNANLLLIKLCNNDLLQINNELFKLIYYKKDEEMITENDVLKLVNIPQDFSVFEITSALSYGNVDKAINLIHKVLESSSFSVLLGVISSHFRRILLSVISDGTNAEIAEKLCVKEYSVVSSKKQAGKLKPMQLIKINELILDIDYSIKSGKLASENAMYYMVFGIDRIIKGVYK